MNQAPQAILVLPHLRVQNANAISSPLTHGFPSITAFMGLMWALERKLTRAGVPLHLHGVGVLCHRHQEQTAPGYVRTFNLTRNPVARDGKVAAIVEEGRIHLDLTLLFSVSEKRAERAPTTLMQGAEATMQAWADRAGDVLSQMRVAGGSLLPTRATPGRRVRPRMEVLPDDAQARATQFRMWRRRLLPGFALVGRDDLLAERLRKLRERKPNATLLDAWLHAARSNYEPETLADDAVPKDGKVQWSDPWRGKGSGWVVPIPVGYAGLSTPYAAGTVRNARDTAVPLSFVESVYSLGEWISPHRLTHLEQLLWHAETDRDKRLYRCRSDYVPRSSERAETAQEWDDDDTYAYT